MPVYCRTQSPRPPRREAEEEKKGEKEGQEDVDGIVVRLFVRAPAWDLPSSCPRSLELKLYAQAACAGATVCVSQYPYSPVTGSLPALQVGRGVYAYEDALRVLEDEFALSTPGVSPAALAEADAFAALVRADLYPAMRALFWLDGDNYAALSAEFAKDACFPLRQYLPWRERADVRAELGSKMSPQRATKTIDKVLDRLSRKLGDSAFLVSNEHVTAADLCVAAHVAVLFRAQLPKNGVRPVIKNRFPNLHAHFQRVFDHVSARAARPDDLRRDRPGRRPRPRLSEPDADADEHKAAAPPGGKQQQQQDESEAERTARRHNQLFVAFSLASVVGYFAIRRTF